MKLTLLIQVDALRYDYINPSDSPFLADLVKEGISGALFPTFGFEPDAAYLAGLYPDECDGGAHYWYEPEATPFVVAKYLPLILDRLPVMPKKVFRKLLTEFIRKTTTYKREVVANIPLDVLPYFAPSTKYLPWDSAFLDQPTIFSICNENEIKWLVHSAPAYRVRIDAGIERLINELKPPVRFAYWHIGDLDSSGHYYGPNSKERKAALRKVDSGIRELYLHLKLIYSHIDLVIIGDHGMAEVRGSININQLLIEAGIKQGNGVIYFLDSTMARFWFFEEKTKKLVIRALEKLELGKILGQEEIDRYHLNYSHNRFGEIVFLANPGFFVSPNFFQGNKSVKGMHGYEQEFPDQQSSMIIHSPIIGIPELLDNPQDMRRIFPTLLDFLELPKPGGNVIDSFLTAHISEKH